MIAAALAAQNASQAKSREQFQVTVNKGQYAPTPIGGHGRDYGTRPVSLPYEDAYSDGFLGIQDNRLSQLVVDAAGGNVSKYDSVYRQALYTAAYQQRAGKTDVTVEGLLTKWGKSGVPEQNGGGGGGGGGGPFSSTSRRISLTDAGTANQIINQALSRYMGRQATAQEQKQFLKALNVQERENVTTTVTKGNVSADGRVRDETSVTKGGFNRDDFAEKFSKSREGYAEYQAATTYLDAFIGALEDKTRVI
jgi:hypothetical protein